MSIAPAPPVATIADDDAITQRRIPWLVGGRLVVATVLLGGTVALGGADLGASALTWLVVAVYATSLGSLLWMQWRRSVRGLVTAQLAVDLAIASALVWLTGGAVSSFSFLYGVVILLSALVAGPSQVAATAGLAGVLYVSIGIALPTGWLPDPSGAMATLAPTELSIALLRNVVGLFLVGLLANVLSARLRRTGGELRIATASAAEYARLTEDIVRSLGSGLITTDLDGRIRSINDAGARILGTSTDALVGTPVAEILPRISATPMSSPARQGERGESFATRPDGSELPVGFTRTPLVGADGTQHGTLVLFQDLTEIAQLRAKAEKAERLAVLGQLAAGLAHEIRNPLGSISGSVELVRDAQELGEEDRRLLGMVLGEVERLNELVTTMLDVGRPVTPDRIDVDLRSLAGEVIEVARRGPTRSAGVEVRLEADEDVHAHADPAQLRQVLWNLVKNAMQYSPRGAVVTVRVRALEDGSVSLEVEDRGAGIAAEDLEKVFDMFFTKRRHGVGLGLALVKQIVEAHGGQVRVESRPGAGARFRVVLPRRGARTSGSHGAIEQPSALEA
ncbi:two-component system sensor histidine kinase NtrB [Sandaracinus amylolyticus]|uniref:histidine kinase n=1 Tax=Sandaracinus amylolyticus TaxID=927083 RepID=A0A0F6W4B3_9BACT|nr:ATP-binding protein [Sandaracinus amylolyticus]AKF07143.1 Sensor histidine kinase [Sandaracinus amylolyticus]